MLAPVRTLPPNPSLEHLRRQARDLQRDHGAAVPEALERIRLHMSRLASALDDEVAAAAFPRTAAQLVIAREYGFATWPRLVAAVEAAAVAPDDSPVRTAIDDGNAAAIARLIEQQPELRDDAFEWTDRRGRTRSITPVRYAHAREQQACIEALVAAGASLAFLGEELWNNTYNANVPQVRRLLAIGVPVSRGVLRTACDHIGSVRHELVNMVIDAGVEWQDGPVMDIHRGDLVSLERRLDDSPALVHDTVEEVTRGPRFACTLLHVAAAHNDVAALELLLHFGADVNAHAQAEWKGITPIFLTLVRGITPTPTRQACADACREAFDILLAAGADLSLRAKCRIGHVEELCTPLGYALACHAAVCRGNVLGSAAYADGSGQIEVMRQRGAPE